jgi:hypothetical protein
VLGIQGDRPPTDPRRAFPRGVATVYASARLSFAPTLTIPDMGAFVRGDLAAVWEDFMFHHQRDLPAAGHRLLGNLAQHDDLGVMSTDDVLLQQLDSDPIPGFDWGKRYFLYFVASASDVQNRDFSRVRAETRHQLLTPGRPPTRRMRPASSSRATWNDPRCSSAP